MSDNDVYLIEMENGKASCISVKKEWPEGVETRRAVLVFSSEEKVEAHIERSAQTNAAAKQPELPLRVFRLAPSDFRSFLKGNSAKYFVADIVAPAIVGPSADASDICHLRNRRRQRDAVTSRL